MVWLIVIWSFLIRIVPILGNHFYFTIDQGRDAVFVRDILSGNLILLGPLAGMHLYHGVLWYYFLAIFYKLFTGSPFGAVFFLILLQCLIIFGVFKFLQKFGNKKIALSGAFLLSVFLPFYEASRYAFNPFLLPVLAILFVFSLSLVYEGKRRYLLLTAVATGLSIHSNIVAFMPFFMTFMIVSVWFIVQRRISFKYFSLSLIIISLFFLPHLLSELSTDFSQTHAFIHDLQSPQNNLHVSRPGHFSQMTLLFLTMLGEVALPQIPALGLILFASLVVFAGLKKKKIPPYVWYTALLFVLSLVWFGINSGFEPWHIVYLPPILLISFCLLSFLLPRKISLSLLILVIIFHILNTTVRLGNYMKNQRDDGLLSNQIKVLDWVYQKSEGKGFFLYTYVPSVYDYHYQYLVYWYGRGKYGYVPCEYSTFPQIDASTYVPHSELYQKPQKSCSNLRFLIIEPSKAKSLEQTWYNQVTKNTELLDSIEVGDIKVEEREIF